MSVIDLTNLQLIYREIIKSVSTTFTVENIQNREKENGS